MSSEEREQAKRIVYSVVYGAGENHRHTHTHTHCNSGSMILDRTEIPPPPLEVLHVFRGVIQLAG